MCYYITHDLCDTYLCVFTYFTDLYSGYIITYFTDLYSGYFNGDLCDTYDTAGVCILQDHHDIMEVRHGQFIQSSRGCQ